MTEYWEAPFHVHPEDKKEHGEHGSVIDVVKRNTHPGSDTV